MARPSLTPQISARILDYIRERRLEPGQHLASQTLADAFKVSRAPVNAALRELEEAKVVRFEPNRGYFLDLAPDALPAATAQAPEQEDELYARIAEDRLAGEVADRVSEAELMRRYDVPRSRLLKTLYGIAEEGWAERLPGNGWEFKPLLTTRQSYAEAYQFRASIECEALLLPSFRPDPVAFAAARTEQQAIVDGGDRTMTRSQLFRANAGFHEMLAACAQNGFYLDALRRVNRLRRLAEFRITVDRSRLPTQAHEHLELLRLIEADRREEAAIFLRRHILGASAIKTPQMGE